MTWEISHTADAWECHRRGLEAQPIEWLREAIATCIADREEELEKAFYDACLRLDINDEFDAMPDWNWHYDRALRQLGRVSGDALVNECMNWTERNNSCSNGGFDFYIDAGGFYSICLDDYMEDRDA